MVKGKTALLLGATGLVGKALLLHLLDDDLFAEVKVFVRRSTEVEHPKLSEYFIDFDAPDNWKNLIYGDVLFSAFGTTLKNAGGKKQQYKIDYTYQFQMAKAAAENGVKEYVLVSSAGASAGSMFFYPRMKGELDRDVQQLGFKHVSLIKPSVLDGNREGAARSGESFAITWGNRLKNVPFLQKYRPIKDAIVAKAMVNAFKLNGKKSSQSYSLNEVFTLANKY